MMDDSGAEIDHGNQNETYSNEDIKDDGRAPRKGAGFLLLAILVSGGIGVYFYLSASSFEQTTPIVKLGTAPSSGNASNNRQATGNEHLETAATNYSSSTEPQALSTHHKDNTSVLTPLPSGLSDSHIALLPLEINEETPEYLIGKVQPDNNEDPYIVRDKAGQMGISLEEDPILSKTEEMPSISLSEIPQEIIKPGIDMSENDLTPSNTVGEIADKKQTADLTIIKKIEDKGDKLEKNEQEVSQKDVNKAQVPVRLKASDNKQEADAPPTVKPQWEIRGASHQRAVLFNKTTKETRTVELGNTIKGIGKIKHIRKESGKWVVTGTIGKITQ